MGMGLIEVAVGVTKMSAPDCKVMSLLACSMTLVPDCKVEVNPDIVNPGIAELPRDVQFRVHPSGNGGLAGEPETDVSVSGTVLIVPVALKKRLVTLALAWLESIMIFLGSSNKLPPTPAVAAPA